jgi:hypothetical protein
VAAATLLGRESGQVHTFAYRKKHYIEDDHSFDIICVQNTCWSLGTGLCTQTPGLACAWMLLLIPPEGVEGDPFEVDDWDTLLQLQGEIEAGTVIEEGSALAMQDRTALTDDWSEDSRKIIVLRWDEMRVAIYTTDGQLIDEPDSFTPLGVQVFHPDFGDHSFLEEWEGEAYYRIPRERVAQADELGGAPPPPPADTAALANRLVPGCRIVMPMDPGEATQRATVCLLLKGIAEGHDSCMVVFDNVNGIRNRFFKKIQLTEELKGALTEQFFVKPGEDIPIENQAAGVFLARCAKKPEGIFFGLESVGEALTAPCSYVAVPCSTENLRYDTALDGGAYVLFDDKQYVLVRWLIHTEPGQVRYNVILGDEEALKPSPELKRRYYVVQLVQGREAMVKSITPPGACSTETKTRFEAGLHEFCKHLTPSSIKNGKFSPPLVEVEEVRFAA